ncbi:hypothetical protein KI387_032673, partial [Taxus chinensis]
MAAFAPLLSNGRHSNPSTLSIQISAHGQLPLKSSKPYLNLQLKGNYYNWGKKSMPVTMSIRMEVGGKKKGGGGAGLLERRELEFPKISTPTTSTPSVDAGGEIGKSWEKRRTGGGDRYKVLLLDHERHTETQVAAILPKVVPSVTSEEAKKCFREARETGESLVTVAVKEHAEFYSQMMDRCGLRSAIEPDGD